MTTRPRLPESNPTVMLGLALIMLLVWVVGFAAGLAWYGDR